MKVSVPIITYNQEKFIGKAIESALNQETNFEFEILVGDDFSTDKTREIIQYYANHFPEKVIPVFHPKNMGGRGLINTLETYKLARGQYIAIFDGDDYWTNSDKLQKQVNFLDKHPDFSTCFHNALITYEDGTASEILNPKNQKKIILMDDLIGEDEIWFMATSSVMFRNKIKHYPDWFMKSLSGDIPRYVLLAKMGKIGYIDEMMSVYRKNAAGMSFADNYIDANFLKNRIAMYKGIDNETNFEYHEKLRKNIARYELMLCESKQVKESPFLESYWALKSLWNSRPNDKAFQKDILAKYVLPKNLMQIYAEVKGRLVG